MTNINENSWKVFVLMLKIISEDKGITHEQIAEKTGLQRSNVTRVFRLDYCPTMRVFLTIASAIEINFFFEDRESKTEINVMFEKAMTELGRRPERFPKN